jgi:hypothetical protein
LNPQAIANIFLGGSMAMDPCDFLVVHPTDDNAGRWPRRHPDLRRQFAIIAVAGHH